MAKLDEYFRIVLRPPEGKDLLSVIGLFNATTQSGAFAFGPRYGEGHVEVSFRTAEQAWAGGRKAARAGYKWHSLDTISPN